MNEQKFTVKELRARKNVTQAEAAKTLGVSVQTYNAWERDISRVAIGKVVSVANYFEVKVENIFLPINLKNIQVRKS